MPKERNVKDTQTSDEKQIIKKNLQPTSRAQTHVAAEQAASASNSEKPKERAGLDEYKALFIDNNGAFEMGENRRFKNRVFLFKEKPSEAVLTALKQNGFTYRPTEKAWTIAANAESRLLCERLARTFSTNGQDIER